MPCLCKCGKPCSCDDDMCYSCMCGAVVMSKEDKENVPHYDDEYGTHKFPAKGYGE